MRIIPNIAVFYILNELDSWGSGIMKRNGQCCVRQNGWGRLRVGNDLFGSFSWRIGRVGVDTADWELLYVSCLLVDRIRRSQIGCSAII